MVSINMLNQDVTATGTHSHGFRPDVIAQALRIGCILKSTGHQAAYLDTWLLDTLWHLLSDAVTADGAVLFYSPHAHDRGYKNTWCAMFTFQACYFYEIVKNGGRLPIDWIQHLI